MPSIDQDIIIKSIKTFEGYDLEEAVLTSKKRENLPSNAFCGPNRTYPAHDKKHVRNALTRIAQFGKNLKPSTRASIETCLKKRAKRMGVEVQEIMEDPFIYWYRKNYMEK